MPGALAHGRGPFTWGGDVFQAVHNAVVLEEVYMMEVFTRQFGMMQPV